MISAKESLASVFESFRKNNQATELKAVIRVGISDVYYSSAVIYKEWILAIGYSRKTPFSTHRCSLAAFPLQGLSKPIVLVVAENDGELTFTKKTSCLENKIGSFVAKEKKLFNTPFRSFVSSEAMYKEELISFLKESVSEILKTPS